MALNRSVTIQAGNCKGYTRKNARTAYRNSGGAEPGPGLPSRSEPDLVYPTVRQRSAGDRGLPEGPERLRRPRSELRPGARQQDVYGRRVPEAPYGVRPRAAAEGQLRRSHRQV